jgi:hypothetical protein
MYCLSEYQAATSRLLHIVAKFCMNIVPLRSGIHNIEVPRIVNGTLADTKTTQIGRTLAPIIML